MPINARGVPILLHFQIKLSKDMRFFHNGVEVKGDYKTPVAKTNFFPKK